MPLRLFVPTPLPGVVWTSKSRGEKAAESAAAPPVSPARAAEVKHETRHAVRWVLFGCLALPALAIIGPGALWWLVPLGAVVALVHLGGHHAEATANPRQRAVQQAAREIRAGVRMGPNGCTWCGSPATHRDPNTRHQVSPLVFHDTAIHAAITRRADDIERDL